MLQFTVRPYQTNCFLSLPVTIDLPEEPSEHLVRDMLDFLKPGALEELKGIIERECEEDAMMAKAKPKRKAAAAAPKRKSTARAKASTGKVKAQSGKSKKSKADADCNGPTDPPHSDDDQSQVIEENAESAAADLQEEAAPVAQRLVFKLVEHIEQMDLLKDTVVTGLNKSALWLA